MNVLDKVNQRYLNNSAFLWEQEKDEKWAMRRNLLTP